MKMPTPAQCKVLVNLANGLSAGDHLRTQSEHGGMTATIRAMAKRGWITYDHELTDAGREVIKELKLA